MLLQVKISNESRPPKIKSRPRVSSDGRSGYGGSTSLTRSLCDYYHLNANVDSPTNQTRKQREVIAHTPPRQPSGSSWRFHPSGRRCRRWARPGRPPAPPTPSAGGPCSSCDPPCRTEGEESREETEEEEGRPKGDLIKICVLNVHYYGSCHSSFYCCRS